MFDTPRGALNELTDDTALERVAVAVLQTRYPQLRITGPSGDLNRDGCDRALFGDRDDTVLAVSCEKSWTTKLKRDFADYSSVPAAQRPRNAIFVTSRSTRQTDQNRYKKLVKDTTGIDLEIFDLNELDHALRSDALHHVAERELHVRPRAPRVLQTANVARERLGKRIDGFDAPLVARVDELKKLTELLNAAAAGGPRLIVIEGPGGIGKTRLAIESAGRHARTLVAASGVAVTPETLVDLPIDEPTVLIVDDAHRAHDLSGLPALFNDPRYDNVTVMLTLRGGYAPRTLTGAGLGDEKAATVGLGSLDRTAIAEIVRGHGIDDERFSIYVITLAKGNPLMAHAMASEAGAKGSYGWTDVADLLRRIATRRLIPNDDDRHHAAALTVAVLTSVNTAADVTALSRAITGLPTQPHEIDGLLADLSDNGIADGPPYVIRPDALAVVLVADALAARGRVRLDLGAALLALGADAVPAGYAASGGPLGIGPVFTGAQRLTSQLRIPRLASQLSVLAQAALDNDDQPSLALLHRAVAYLLPDDADIDAWTDVLTLAQSVAPAQPRLLSDLHGRVTRSWPPPTTPNVFGGVPPERHLAAELAQLATAAGTLGIRVAQSDPVAAVRWLLDIAYLIEPHVGNREVDRLLGHIDSIAGPGRADIAAGAWDDALRRRREVLDAVLAWTRTARDERAAAARVSWRALAPFLTMVAEGTDMGTVEAADTFVMSSYVLPEAADVEAGLLGAVGRAMRLLDDIPNMPSDISEAVVALPRELRAIGLRGLPRSEGPLPLYAVQALERAAREVDYAVAKRWAALPVKVRRAAVDATLSYAPPGPRDLAAAITAGSAVAAAAAADDELRQLLTMAPIDAAVVPGLDDEDYAGMQAHYAAQAEALAATLTTRAGLALLDSASTLRAGQYGDGAMVAFARELGRRARDSRTVLAAGDTEDPRGLTAEVIRGLREKYPEDVDRWALDATSSRALLAAIAICDDLPDVHDHVLTRAHASVCRDQTPEPREGPSGPGRLVSAVLKGARETVGLLRRPLDAPHSARSLIGALHRPPRTPLEQIDGGQELLAMQLARHQAWCRSPLETRIERLAALAAAGPITAIPSVMMPLSHLLRTNIGGGLSIPDDTLFGLVTGVRRYLAARGPFDSPAQDIATGAAALMAWAPKQMGQLLADRLKSTGGVAGLPYEWRTYVNQLPADARARLVTAYVEVMPQLTGDDHNVLRREAVTLLAQLGGGSEPLLALIREWTQGNHDDRARAALALADAWHLSDWPDLVASLIAKGLTDRSIQELLHGIEPTGFGPDIADDMKPRLTVLDHLLQSETPAVRDFAQRAKDIVNTAIQDYQNDAGQRRRGYT